MIIELMLAINDRLTLAIQNYEHETLSPIDNQDVTDQDDDNLSRSFEIGDDDDEEDELIDELENEDEVRGSNLEELRSEIEAEESAAFLKAKKAELEDDKSDTAIVL